MVRFLSRRATSLLLFSVIFSCVSIAVQAQSATSALSVGGQGYNVEVTLDNQVYKVKLFQGTEAGTTEKINYFTLGTFREVVFKIHKISLTAKGAPGITPSIRNSAEASISSAFLELLTELYNIQVSGQKIGEVTLMSSITTYDESTPPMQSALGSKASLRQRGGKKWMNRIVKKKKRKLGMEIKDLRKKEILASLSEVEKEKLCQLQEALIKLYSTTSQKKANKPVEAKLSIETARIVFEDGSIKEITIKGINENNKVEVYSNKFSIGTSTRRNIQDFDRISLYQESHEGKMSRSKKIILSDAIDYERLVGLRTNDYSPADVTIQLEPEKVQELFKAPSSQLFTLNVFSDLAGFDQNNPNGLVQLEFNKRINLWTRRTDAWFPKSMGFGAFTHMTPTFELTKIEENNRSIKLLGDIEASEQLHLNPLELQRFSYAQLTNELNLIDLQGPSHSIHVNLSAGFNVTHIQDTTGTGMDQEIFNENINSLLLGANIKAIFNPESKWAFEVGSRWTYFDPLNSSFTFRSRENDELKGPNYLLNTWEFFFTWNTGDIESGSQNKLFARFRFNLEWDYWNNNYSEFQIGYSIFLKSNQVKTGKK